MKVVQYLKEYGLKKLEAELFIKVKEYPEHNLIVLNYNQIDSPNAHPIVMECRSLILDYDFNVVSRSFDRFFNYGEQPQTQEHVDWNKAVCYDKIDGSLIKIYFHNGRWEIATRGMAFAESASNGFDITFRGLVLKALSLTEGEFQEVFAANFDTCVTYICEVTSMENRVVRKYDGYKLHYLAARNKNGNFEDWSSEAHSVGMQLIGAYKFSTPQDCMNTAAHLKDLDEGYVLYQDGAPVCKIKSPAYVAVHHLRGEGLNPKRISQLVLTNEQEEYLKYFPEDREHIEPYTLALKNLKHSIIDTWNIVSVVEDQKEFAMSVKHLPYSAVMFQMKKSQKPIGEVWTEQRDSYKLELLQTFKEAA